MTMKYVLIILFLANSLLVNAQEMRRFMQPKGFKTSAIPYGNNAKAGKYVIAGDTKIYYEVYGKGNPFIILHGGIFGSTIEMAQFIDSLSKKYQVIAVSTRGHGKSGMGSGPATFEKMADDVLAVINAETKDSVTVLGFSYGGYAGYKLASMYPEKIKKLIVIGAGERHPGDMDNTATTEEGYKLDSLYWKQQLALMPEPRRLPEMFDTVKDFFNKRMVVDAALLGTIKCPVLVMAGDHDQFLPVTSLANAATFIPRGSLAIIPGSSHGAFLEHFPIVWASVSTFLSE